MNTYQRNFQQLPQTDLSVTCVGCGRMKLNSIRNQQHGNNLRCSARHACWRAPYFTSPDAPSSSYISFAVPPSTKMPGHCSLVPSCCGVTLRNGTLWLAEICTLVGAALIILSSISMDILLTRWNIDKAPLLAHLYAIPMILGILQVITSIFLAYGAIVEKSGYLIPWLIFFTLQTALLFLATCALTVVSIINVEPMPVGAMIFLTGTAYCHVFRYFITVVYSYYRQLLICHVDNSSQVMQLT